MRMKFRPTIQGNVERIIELIHSTARDGADAILFPECAVTVSATGSNVHAGQAALLFPNDRYW